MFNATFNNISGILWIEGRSIIHKFESQWTMAAEIDLIQPNGFKEDFLIPLKKNIA